MKCFQVAASKAGITIRDAVSLEAVADFGSLREALAHLEALVDEHGAIDVQVDSQRWSPT
jgi:hypothetical protein